MEMEIMLGSTQEFLFQKKVQKLNTYMYIVWVSPLYRGVQKDLHRIISTLKKNRQSRCQADWQIMLYALLQQVSLVTQLVC